MIDDDWGLVIDRDWQIRTKRDMKNGGNERLFVRKEKWKEKKKKKKAKAKAKAKKRKEKKSNPVHWNVTKPGFWILSRLVDWVTSQENFSVD